MVNFYRDIYPKQAQTLARLTDLCGHKRKFVWTEIHEKAFQQMKHIMSQDTLLTYPQFDQPFVIHTDASDNQIGGVDMQNNKLLGFFSKKLTKTQCKYPVTEQELLAFVETLKYFKHMLLGLAIIVQTDHKNLTHPTSTHTLDWVLHQRIWHWYPVHKRREKCHSRCSISSSNTGVVSIWTGWWRLSFEPHSDLQQSTIRRFAAKHLSEAPRKIFSNCKGGGLTLCRCRHRCYIRTTTSPQLDILNWYHTTLQHLGIKHMQATLRKHFYLPGMDAAVTELVRTCATCQTCKITAVKKYGKIPVELNYPISTCRN